MLNFANLHSTVPAAMQAKIEATPLVWASSSDDGYNWRWVRDEKFSIKSPYFNLFLNEGAEPFNATWTWKLQIPNKVLVFVWLCTHNRLHSQQFRASIGLADSALCAICGDGIEDSSHILRNCRLRKDV